MSEKELLYIDDALSHQKHLKTKCCDFSSQIQDPELKKFLKDLETRNQTIFSNLFQLLS